MKGTYVGCQEAKTQTLFSKVRRSSSNHEVIALSKRIKGQCSGMDIVLGRGNANKLLFRILRQLADNHSMRQRTSIVEV